MTLQALREALKPFAELANRYDGHPKHGGVMVMLEVNVLRRAREAIEALALTVPGETEWKLESDLIKIITSMRTDGNPEAVAVLERVLDRLGMCNLNEALSSRSLDGWNARNAVIEECATALREASRVHYERISPGVLTVQVEAVLALKEAKHD